MQLYIVAALALLSLVQLPSRATREAEKPAGATSSSGTSASASTSSASGTGFTSSPESEPAQLDDPLGASDTTSNQDDANAMMDEICVRCYDKVKVAQDLVDIYESLLRKQKKLISRKKAAAEAAAALASEQAESRPRSAKSPRSASLPAGAPNSTVRSRTLLSEPIVVSRLRVARSPGDRFERLERLDHYAGGRANRPAEASAPLPSPSSRDAKYLNKKDQELERLKREQQRQKEATCRALLEVRDCLDLLSRECIGNLQFHSYEVFSDQYHGKFRCPYPNNPGLKPLPGLLPRSMADEDQARLPVPRPISSDEEVRQRLQKILPDRQFARPLGVMLRPTLATTNSAGAGSSRRLQLTESTGGGADGSKQSFGAQQQQFQAAAEPLEQRRPFAFKSRELPASYVISSSSSAAAAAAGPSWRSDEQTVNLVNLGKLLLVPCCFAILVALLALASLRYRPAQSDDDEQNEDVEKC